jgi:hypothetical protein
MVIWHTYCTAPGRYDWQGTPYNTISFEHLSREVTDLILSTASCAVRRDTVVRMFGAELAPLGFTLDLGKTMFDSFAVQWEINRYLFGLLEMGRRSMIIILGN